MEDIKILAVCSKMAAKYTNNYEIIDITNYKQQNKELSFHPNGNCGCILSGDDYLFGIRCNHLIWAEGNCEGIESFWNKNDHSVAIEKYFDVDKTYNSILVYGNHKGLLRMKLVVFHEK